MLNSFYFARGNAIAVESKDITVEAVSNQQLATAVAEMLNYGYTPSEELYATLKEASVATVTSILNEILPEMKKTSGSGESVTPMYPNFPKEVLEASETELFMNAILHYFGDMVGYRIMPDIKTANRSIRLDFPNAQVINLGDAEGFLKSVTMFLTTPVAWGNNEHELLKALISSRDMSALQVINENMSIMTNRENKASVFAELAALKVTLNKELYSGAMMGNEETAAALGKVITILVSSLDTYNTATDALRIAAAWSGFSPSLSAIKTSADETTRIKFANMPNSLRKDLLSIIDTDKDTWVNLSRRPGLFKALGEKIHPRKYVTKYPRAAMFFDKIRNNDYSMPEALLQKMFAEGNLKGAVQELAYSPGTFTRKLNQTLVLAEKSNSVDYVLSEYNFVTPFAPAKLLWQAYKFFDDYYIKEVRATIPKSSTSAQYFIFADNEATLNETTIYEAKKVLYAAIVENYANKVTLEGKKIFINPSLTKIAIPGNLRDNTNLRYSMGRGSRMTIPEVNNKTAGTLRLFMHWSDIKGERVDLDLSAESYASDCNMIGSVWYGDLRNSYAVHSGDITSAPEGAAEYIDINVEKAAAAGIRYIAASVTSYSGQPLDSVPEAYAGCMAISDDAQVGEIFDARAVTTKFQLGSSSRKVVTIVLDIVNKEIILADASPLAREIAGNNVISTNLSTGMALKALLSQSIISVSEVVTANVIARKGQVVTSEDEADITFDYTDKGLSVPLDEILSEWL